MSSHTDPSALSRLLERLEQVRQTSEGWQARCPAHDDQKTSLSIRQVYDSCVLLKCHAGCGAAAVVQALGLQMRDLFPRRGDGGAALGQMVAHYDYRDEKGRLLYQVVRFSPKTFRQRRSDGAGGWRWGLGGVRRVLYRLPQLLASPREQTVFAVEGEKDADAVAGLGLTAVTNCGGACKWLGSYSESLRQRSVCIVPDNDDAGLDHAAAVVRDLVGTASSVRVLELPGLAAKGDISDWLQGGGTKEALLALTVLAPLAADWLTARREGQPSRTRDDGLLTCLADVSARPVHWLWPGRLALGKLAILDGDPGLGKSLVSLDLAARISSGRAFPDQSPVWPGDVVIVNCEDGVADTIRPRLEGLGADLRRVHVLRGPSNNGRERLPCLPRDLSRLDRALYASGAVLTIVDPIMAFLDETVSSGNDQSVRQALSPLAALAETSQCAILLIRHLNKSGGSRAVYRGGGSIGIIGACRSAWMIARHPDDDRQRVLAQTKNNLAPPQPALAYQIDGGSDGSPKLQWLGTVDFNADELLGGPATSDGGQLERGCALLRDALADGPLPLAELLPRLAKQGISRRTLFRARQQVGILAENEKTTAGIRAVWRLPTPPMEAKQDAPQGMLLPPPIPRFIADRY